MTLVYCFDGTLKTCFKAGSSDGPACRRALVYSCVQRVCAGAHSIHPNVGEVEAGEYKVQGHSWLDSSPGVSETLLQQQQNYLTLTFKIVK